MANSSPAGSFGCGLRTGPDFELTSHLIDAVRAGIGLGLVPKVLVNDELESGQLVCHGPHMKSRRSYYLVYPRRALALPALNVFKVWLLNDESHLRSDV